MDNSVQSVNKELLAELKQKARKAKRRRINYNFHKSEDKMQRMVNALTKGTYIRPHWHLKPDKNEHFVIIEGKAGCISFLPDGQIEQVLLLESQENVAADIRAGIIHTIVCLSEEAILMEFIEGPYDGSTHKKFAEFAPEEESPLAGQYLQKLEKLFN